MTFSSEEIAKLASMAKLEVTEEEKATLASELSDVVEFVGALSSIDTTGIPETNQVTAITHATYEDEPSEEPFASGIEEAILKTSEQPVEMKQIKVPPVL